MRTADAGRQWRTSSVHGPISISLAWSLEYLPATIIAVKLAPLSDLGQQKRGSALRVSPDAVCWLVARPLADNSPCNTKAQ
jgi:hypothetical protein